MPTYRASIGAWASAVPACGTVSTALSPPSAGRSSSTSPIAPFPTARLDAALLAPCFSIIARCSTRSAEVAANRIRLRTSRGDLAFDYLILCTGFTVDWQRRPELQSLASRVLLWHDLFTPGDRKCFEQADYPFLGDDLEFLEKHPGTAPWVRRVHCFTFPAFMSHGPISGDVPAIRVDAERVATGIVGALFAEDYERNWARLLAWDTRH